MAFRVQDFVPAPPFRALEGLLRELARRGVVGEEVDAGGGHLRGPIGALRFLGKWIARAAVRDDVPPGRPGGGRARAWAEFVHPVAEAPPAAKGGATTTPLSPALTLTTGMLEWAFPSSEGYDVEAMLRDALLQGGPHSHGASIQFQLPSTTDNESGGGDEEAGGDDAALAALAQLQQLNALDEEQPTGSSSSSFPRVRGAAGAAKSAHTKAQQVQQQGRQANQQHGGRRSGRRGSVGKSAGAQAPKRRTQASLKRPAQYELPPPGLGESNGVPRALLHTLAW